jgi:hypothetical protein
VSLAEYEQDALLYGPAPVAVAVSTAAPTAITNNNQLSTNGNVVIQVTSAPAGATTVGTIRGEGQPEEDDMCDMRAPRVRAASALSIYQQLCSSIQ